MKSKLIGVTVALFIGLSGIGLLYSTSLRATSPATQEEIANTATAVFAVENMTCVACPITVSKAMSKVNGVKDVSIDFRNKRATVVFDPTLTSAQFIGAASTDVGYPASLSEGAE